MGKFKDSLDALDCHLVAKTLLIELILEFVRDYEERGTEAVEEWFG